MVESDHTRSASRDILPSHDPWSRLLVGDHLASILVKRTMLVYQQAGD
jgi:hypothetical protein